MILQRKGNRNEKTSLAIPNVDPALRGSQKEFISHERGTLTEMKSFFRGSSISVGKSFCFFAKSALVADFGLKNPTDKTLSVGLNSSVGDEKF
jgi:hypothetical protein